MSTAAKPERSSAGNPVNDSARGTSQLFEVLYLGSTVVDGHCSHAVMPWISEELKLRTEQRTLTWLTSGDSGVSYVADSGVELFRHLHSAILRCATGTDGITFSYIIREGEEGEGEGEGEEQYTCHVFQCLTPEEAAQLMQKFKLRAKGDHVIRPSPTTKQPSQTTHTVHYVCSVDVQSSTHSSDLLDNILEKYHRRRHKLSRKGQRTETRLQEEEGGSLAKSTAVTNSTIVGTSEEETSEYRAAEVVSEVPKLIGTSAAKDADRSPDCGDAQSVSSQTPSLPSLTDRQVHMTREDSCDVSIKLTRATPERMFCHEDDEKRREWGEGEPEGGGEKEGYIEEEDYSVPVVDDTSTQHSDKDSDDDFSDSHSSTSCTTAATPDPGAAEEHTPNDDITPVEDSRLLHNERSVLRLRIRDLEERPASCPPLELGAMTDEPRVSCKDEKMRRAGERQGSGAKEGEVEGEGVGEGEVEGEGEGEEETDVGFDTLPELDSLQQSPMFRSLGSPTRSEGDTEREEDEVRLIISPNMVQVVRGSKVILRRTIRSIACCTQGEKRSECVGVVCREGRNKKTFICHIFRTVSQAMATAVMDSFKSSFVQALNSSPTAMCDSCPLRQLHSLCQNLEGVPTPVAQSRIQECLSQLSEADYSSIMAQYKASEHADHDFTQLVVLVSLIREHLQKKQKEHVHPAHTSSSGGTLDTQQPLKPPRLSKLERAKLALTSSFDNLRKGTSRSTEKRQRQFGTSLTTDDANITVPLLTTTENRRASLDPKLTAAARRKWPAATGKMGLVRSSSARVPAEKECGGDSSGGEEVGKGGGGGGGGGGGRSRAGSWLRRLRSSKVAAPSSQEDESDGEACKTEATEEGGKESSPITSPLLQERKSITPAQKLARFESKDDILANPDPDPESPVEQTTTPQPPTLPPSVFMTPTRAPLQLKSEGRVRKVRSSVSPPPAEGTTAAYGKYRRDHKRSESMSWRHEIFESVTPVKERTTEKTNCTFHDWEIIEPASFDQLGRSTTTVCVTGEGEEEERGSPRNVPPRERWCRAIEQLIMLRRMEKENQSIMKANTEADTKRIKLCYQDPSINLDTLGRKWAELLSRPHPPRQSELRPLLIEGVTPTRRGEVWSLLIQLYRDKHPSHPPPPSPTLSLSQLSQERTDYDNAIIMDLGRTFPSHPYFSSEDERGGQRALATILHAYAVSDQDTGYCQGLSFIAGMILMHTKDEGAAFKMLCQLMHVYSYRDVYSPDLSVLQIRLYQLSRLLHDVLPALHNHLGTHEITPFYYAAPWFLTLFSSQYPIAFVARVMDLFFLDGPDIVFKVSVALLRYYETHILRCSTMESISEFLKESMPQLVLNHMTTILEDAHHMDLGNKLQSYETEYFVLEELTTSFSVGTEVQDLKSLNESFRNHNKELIEQLAFCRGMISNLESTLAALQETVREQQLRLDRLEAGQPPSQPPSPECKNTTPECKNTDLDDKATGPDYNNTSPGQRGADPEINNSDPVAAPGLMLKTTNPDSPTPASTENKESCRASPESNRTALTL